jgi:hypothetical protein
MTYAHCVSAHVLAYGLALQCGSGTAWTRPVVAPDGYTNASTRQRGDTQTTLASGLVIGELTPGVFPALPLPPGLKRAVVVGEVRPDSLADRAGLHVGDVILEINGHGVATAAQANRELEMIRDGQAATLRLWRGRQDFTLKIDLSQTPDADFADLFNRFFGEQRPPSGTGQAGAQTTATFIGTVETFGLGAAELGGLPSRLKLKEYPNAFFLSNQHAVKYGLVRQDGDTITLVNVEGLRVRIVCKDSWVVSLERLDGGELQQGDRRVDGPTPRLAQTAGAVPLVLQGTIPEQERAAVEQIRSQGSAGRLTITGLMPASTMGLGGQFTLEQPQANTLTAIREFAEDSVVLGGIGGRGLAGPLSPQLQVGEGFSQTLLVGSESPALPVSAGAICRFKGEVKIAGYTFTSDPEQGNRLSFTFIESLGFVWLRGKGSVTSKDGQVTRVGY